MGLVCLSIGGEGAMMIIWEEGVGVEKIGGGCLLPVFKI